MYEVQVSITMIQFSPNIHRIAKHNGGKKKSLREGKYPRCFKFCISKQNTKGEKTTKNKKKTRHIKIQYKSQRWMCEGRTNQKSFSRKREYSEYLGTVSYFLGFHRKNMTLRNPKCRYRTTEMKVRCIIRLYFLNWCVVAMPSVTDVDPAACIPMEGFFPSGCRRLEEGKEQKEKPCRWAG